MATTGTAMINSIVKLCIYSWLLPVPENWLKLSQIVSMRGNANVQGYSHSRRYNTL